MLKNRIHRFSFSYQAEEDTRKIINKKNFSYKRLLDVSIFSSTDYSQAELI